MLNENARAKSDNDLISVSLEFFFERYEVLIKIMESGLFTLLGAAIGIIGNIIGSYFGAQRNQKLSENNHRYRLREQLKYLSDLCKAYQNNDCWGCAKEAVLIEGGFFISGDSEEKWDSNIFIFNMQYKEDLLYSGLEAKDLFFVLKWMNLWERLQMDFSAHVKESIMEYECVDVIHILHDSFSEHTSNLCVMSQNVDKVLKKLD